MKIGIKATHIVAGGGLTHLRGILDHRPKQSKDDGVIIYCAQSQRQMFCAYDSSYTVRYFTMPSWGSIARIFWEQAILPIYVWRDKCNVLFEPGNVGSILCPCPRVQLIHSLAPFDPDYVRTESVTQRLRLKLLEWVTCFSARRSAGIIFISHFARRLLHDRLLGSGQDTTVIYHAGNYDTDCQALSKPESTRALCQASAHLDESSNTSSTKGSPCRTILCVSHIYRYKNIETLFKGFAQASEELASPIALQIAGEVYDRAYHAQLLALCADLRVSEKVAFLGSLPQEALYRLYRECDLFVFPSLLENCPTILIEALTAGAPTITAEYGVMPEIAESGAAYFGPRDYQKLGSLLAFYLTSEKSRKELGARATQRSQRFDWKQSAFETFSFLQSVAGLRSTRATSTLRWKQETV